VLTPAPSLMARSSASWSCALAPVCSRCVPTTFNTTDSHLTTLSTSVRPHPGRRHGHGLEVFPRGGRYTGEYEDGERCGLGRLTLASGAVYEGEFKAGKSDGTGTMTTRDGAVLCGEWRVSELQSAPFTHSSHVHDVHHVTPVDFTERKATRPRGVHVPERGPVRGRLRGGEAVWERDFDVCQWIPIRRPLAQWPPSWSRHIKNCRRGSLHRRFCFQPHARCGTHR
jgi:hypothetical protein